MRAFHIDNGDFIRLAEMSGQSFAEATRHAEVKEKALFPGEPN